jgi:hypothetical protein
LRREAHESRRADVSRDGVAALEGLAIGELYEALGSATTPDYIEAQVLQLSENRSDPSSLRQHFDSAEVVSNGLVTPPASTRRSAIAPTSAQGLKNSYVREATGNFYSREFNDVSKTLREFKRIVDQQMNETGIR